jgi:hypothetical protein
MLSCNTTTFSVRCFSSGSELRSHILSAFSIGNEIVKDVPSTVAAPFIKAAARDVKAYLKSKNSNALVGYSSTDGTVWRNPLADFLTCDSDDTSIDLWGLNN